MTSTRTLQFLGATGTVTGSKFLITSGGSRVLVDCGLYQGMRELRERNWQDLPFSPAALDAVVLTHAHIDHCGWVPRLVAAGFDGPIYATQGTADLARIVLPDSGHLNEGEAERATRTGSSRHDPALPLYTEEDAWGAVGHLQVLQHGIGTEIAPELTVRFSRAGHSLGAASVEVQLGPNGPVVVVSGDLGRRHHPLLVAPDPPPPADQLLVESTYGDRRHDDADAIDELARAIDTTIARGGNVLIPASGVDRAEVLLYHLAELARAGRLPSRVPIYVDSQMALAALQVYRDAIDRGDPEIRPELIGRTDLFDLPGLREVHDVEGSKALKHTSSPSIIISAADTASGGRAVHHLAHLLPDPSNTILLVGYQAVGTRGRQLIEGATELKMMGRYARVRAQVVDLHGFSVHADAAELLEWVASAEQQPETVYVVHGEPCASAALAASIEHALDWTAVVPRDGERVRLDRFVP